MATVRHSVGREPSGDHRGEIFPTLGAFIGGGAGRGRDRIDDHRRSDRTGQ